MASRERFNTKTKPVDMVEYLKFWTLILERFQYSSVQNIKHISKMPLLHALSIAIKR